MSSAAAEDRPRDADRVRDDAAGERADDLGQADDDESVRRHDAAASSLGTMPWSSPFAIAPLRIITKPIAKSSA